MPKEIVVLSTYADKNFLSGNPASKSRTIVQNRAAFDDLNNPLEFTFTRKQGDGRISGARLNYYPNEGKFGQLVVDGLGFTHEKQPKIIEATFPITEELAERLNSDEIFDELLGAFILTGPEAPELVSILVRSFQDRQEIPVIASSNSIGESHIRARTGMRPDK